jgi:hypothetical protein
MLRLLPVLLLALSVGCDLEDDVPVPTEESDRSDEKDVEETVEPIRFNHIQSKGTHNSYHVAPQHPFVPDWNYTHEPLDKQLGAQGVRQLELDLNRHVLDGHFEVFHVLGVDEQTTCRRFTDCLSSVKSWSDQNPGHHPVAIMLELKDPFIGDFADDYFETLEEEILSVFSESQLIIPDRIKGEHDTLRDAVLTDGWPRLRELRGQVFFWLDDSDE